ncbi:hypothetical protein Acr_18g0001900 [Actinidia rufa]|uniref:Tetratricopeptide repeat (TPR)-like superfamily protein n=1 Tax=Actinidia rufa TaxID=165716 RepID=A0A7J0G5F4_9ERIC|nr:hypothetical protein Acr_18g0001900 [Actinidia rufa]
MSSLVLAYWALAQLENLEVGMQVHLHIVKCGIRMDQFVTGLINLCAKGGELELANWAFFEVNNPQLSAWTTLIGGCVQKGRGRETIDHFCKLHSAGLKPNERTFSSVFGAFADAMKIEGEKQLHSLIIKLGFHSFLMVGNAVVDFYSKSGLLKKSSKTFEEMDVHDIVSWNAADVLDVYSMGQANPLLHFDYNVVEVPSLTCIPSVAG